MSASYTWPSRSNLHFYSTPVGVRSIAINLSVCLSICEHISGTAVSIVTQFWTASPVAVAWSSSGGVAIRYVYVLPVLWMTLHLAIVGRMAEPQPTTAPLSALQYWATV